MIFVSSPLFIVDSPEDLVRPRNRLKITNSYRSSKVLFLSRKSFRSVLDSTKQVRCYSRRNDIFFESAFQPMSWFNTSPFFQKESFYLQYNYFLLNFPSFSVLNLKRRNQVFLIFGVSTITETLLLPSPF